MVGAVTITAYFPETIWEAIEILFPEFEKEAIAKKIAK